MKSKAHKVKKQRWSRKVYFKYTKFKSNSRKLKTRKQSCTTIRVKTSATSTPSYVKPKPAKFKLNAKILTVGHLYEGDRAKVLSFFDEICTFLSKPENESFRGEVRLKLENVEKVDPTGCAFLFSYIEMFQALYPAVQFKINYPNKIKGHIGTNVDTIQPNHVFNHLGLYKQLGSTKAPLCHTLPPPKVSVWVTESFTNSDSALVGEILKNVCEKVPTVSGEQVRQIYKILIEAVNNCPEHAYDEQFMSDKGLSFDKTRCLFAIIEERLVVVVGDLGVGIRYTLENGKAKNSWNLIKRWERIFNNKRFFSSKDSECLEGMINIRNVRARKSRHENHDYRGWGGVDLKNAIKGLGGKLLVMSGTGSLMLDASNPDDLVLTPKDFDIGLNGTLISMSIPLKD
ncbi:hypothetical protein [Vibrio atlanticus]|uniref:ATP-binding protein n=1 Tax=Vibrio atlanticus TaxID=693153 RepID=A0A1C3IVU9_9VIBR|nr:hypothetical protein [Vibrio atlanticus]SBS65543.1 hypothetical protein VAT7223_02761 [Vibrio atlanticus]